LLELFEKHRKVLGKIYGEFPHNPSFKPILEIEYDRWLKNDESQAKNLNKLLKKKSELSIDDWILAITTYGIPADRVA